MTTESYTQCRTTEKKPKVSVVMAIHNEETYGPTAIQSILDQTFCDFEFIIIDDASTDSTPGLLADFAAKDNRITVLTNGRNLSVPLSANRGLSMAKGEYIARMDSDDIAYPNRLADQVAFLDEHPEFIIVGGGIEYIDNEGTIFRTFDKGSNWWEFEWASFFRAPLAQPCAMFRANAVKKFGLFYDNRFNRAADFEYWHRLLRHGKGCELSRVYLQYRIHDRNVSVVHKATQQQVARNAAEKNIRFRFPGASTDGSNTLLDLLYSTAPLTPSAVADAIKAIEVLEQRFASARELSKPQIDDLRRTTAKILLNAIRARFLMRSASAIDVISLLRRYLPEYCAVSWELARRRAGAPVAFVLTPS